MTTIQFNNKTITVTGRNTRVYKKMTGQIPDIDAVKIYVRAFHPTDARSIDELLLALPAESIENAINQGIEQEARDCYSDEFYEQG